MSDGVTDYPHLFAPGTVGRLGLANRYVVAPMTRVSASPTGVATDRMVAHYREFARGGFALVITEGTYIDESHSQGYRDQPGIANDEQMEGWRPVAEAVHEAGAAIVIQLLHAGALSQANRFTDESVAPSAIQPVGAMAARYYGDGPYKMPREITRAEIAAALESYERAAARAIEVGFDGVEIHGANGYLPDQFLTVRSNARTDAYGGTLEKRLRFHVEAIEAVRRGVAGRGVVGIRISQSKVNDNFYEWPGGMADAEVVFPTIAGAGPDYIHISTHQGLVEVFGSGLTLAGVCKRLTGATTIACGKLHDPAFAERILATGEADFAAVAKGAVADPHLPRRIAEGRTPVAFDPEMLSPVATLETTRRYRAAHGLSW